MDDSGHDTAGPAASLVIQAPVLAADGSFGRLLPQDVGFLLGRATAGEGYGLVGLDDDFQPNGTEQRLSGPDRREPDHDLVQDDGAIFHALLTLEEEGNGVAIQRFDDALSQTGGSGHVPIEDDERALDQTLMVADDRVWLGTEYREEAAWWSDNIAPGPELARGLLLRELSLDLEQLDVHRLTADIPGSSTPGQFWGLGASQLREGDTHWIFAASPSGEPGQFEEGESVGTRRIWALEYDLGFTLRQTWGPLTPADQDAYWCTGVKRHGSVFLISYTFRTPEDGPVKGPPNPDEGNIGVVAAHADLDLEPVAWGVATGHDSQAISDDRAAHRSTIASRSDELWLVWDDADGIWIGELSFDWE